MVSHHLFKVIGGRLYIISIFICIKLLWMVTQDTKNSDKRGLVREPAVDEGQLGSSGVKAKHQSKQWE